MAETENVITKTTDFVQWFLPKAGKMPRDFKFLFGDRIIGLQLDLLDLLIEAYYTAGLAGPTTLSEKRESTHREAAASDADLHGYALAESTAVRIRDAGIERHRRDGGRMDTAEQTWQGHSSQ